MKRLTSIDFWRGIAIFFTAMFAFPLYCHGINFTHQSIANIFNGTIGLIIIAALIFVFIHWRGFFLMISAVANFYQMDYGVKKGKNVWGIFGKQIFAGVMLVISGKTMDYCVSILGIY